jgi:hypothetical protein
MHDARARGQRLGDAWQAALKRQIDALDALADGALADNEATTHDLATDLCSFWVGCWADAFDVLHEACSACLHPGPSPGNGWDYGQGRPVITFVIDQGAEAADPIEIPGLTGTDAPKVTVKTSKATGQSTTIPPDNIRVTTYRSKVFLSLVELGALRLPPGVYSGDLFLDNEAFAGVTVRVNAVGPPPS